MNKSNWELWAVIITLIEFDINYYVYTRRESLLDILFIIVTSIILGLVFILSDIYKKLKDVENNQEEFNKKLIRDKELENIRLDLREIKGVLKKKR